MREITEQMIDAAIIANTNAKLFGGEPRDWVRAALEAALSEKLQGEAVAEIVSAYGDPEAFGERELVALVDIQKFPYRTKLYASSKPTNPPALSE